MAEDSLVLIKPEADVEIIAFYSEAIRLREYAEARVITTNDDLIPATNDLTIIARVKRGMEAKRKEYLSPFQNHIKETNEAYKLLMSPIEQADKITRNKILAFSAEQERKRREAEAIESEKLELARREAALNGGEITIDLSPLVKPEVVPDRVNTELGSTGVMKLRKWEVEDLSKVPLDYMMIDAAKVGKVVRAGIPAISGIRIWEENILRVAPK